MNSIVHEIDDFDLPAFAAVAATFGHDRYGFIVTPNVDHLVRYYDDPAFRNYYQAAAFILLDSRFVSRLLRLIKGLKLQVCTGSDLTAELLAKTVTSEDRVLLVGGSPQQAKAIAKMYGLRDLHHHNPVMGFINDPIAVEECLAFVEGLSPFRFCFLAVGSPQQESVAYALKVRGKARGMALCVGASLNFITGAERRAPRWLQQAGLEWLYRLSCSPGRLFRRYLIRGPRIFAQLFHCDVVLRKRASGFD